MKKCFLCLPALMFLVGCTSTSPYSSMYSDYGFTYDYKEAPVPSSLEVPATTTNPAPVFLIQVPAPTVIYQQAPATASAAPESNATAETSEPNPYKGSYVIPPKVVVVPQETIIHENAGAANTGSNVVVQPTPSSQYPGYIYPGVIGGFTTTNTNATNTVTGGVTNSNTVMTTNIVGGTNVVTISNIVNSPAGAGRTNAVPPFTPVPGPTSAPLPGISTPQTRPQANTGGGTGPAGAAPQGPFSPPPTTIPQTAPPPAPK